MAAGDHLPLPQQGQLLLQRVVRQTIGDAGGSAALFESQHASRLAGTTAPGGQPQANARCQPGSVPVQDSR